MPSMKTVDRFIARVEQNAQDFAVEEVYTNNATMQENQNPPRVGRDTRRFSWLFIGYSIPYQFFSGAVETVAGLLLFYRRTVTAGMFAATGACMNGVMINRAYDVRFRYSADTVRQTVPETSAVPRDSTFLFTMGTSDRTRI